MRLTGRNDLRGRRGLWRVADAASGTEFPHDEHQAVLALEALQLRQVRADGQARGVAIHVQREEHVVQRIAVEHRRGEVQQVAHILPAPARINEQRPTIACGTQPRDRANIGVAPDRTVRGAPLIGDIDDQVAIQLRPVARLRDPGIDDRLQPLRIVAAGGAPIAHHRDDAAPDGVLAHQRHVERRRPAKIDIPAHRVGVAAGDAVGGAGIPMQSIDTANAEFDAVRIVQMARRDEEAIGVRAGGMCGNGTRRRGGGRC